MSHTSKVLCCGCTRQILKLKNCCVSFTHYTMLQYIMYSPSVEECSEVRADGLEAQVLFRRGREPATGGKFTVRAASPLLTGECPLSPSFLPLPSPSPSLFPALLSSSLLPSISPTFPPSVFRPSISLSLLLLSFFTLVCITYWLQRALWGVLNSVYYLIESTYTDVTSECMNAA